MPKLRQGGILDTPGYNPKVKDETTLTVKQAASRMGCSTCRVRRAMFGLFVQHLGQTLYLDFCQSDSKGYETSVEAIARWRKAFHRE